MAQTAEKLAKRLGIPREEQDAFALRSTHLGEKAATGGVFEEEIVPVEIKRGPKTTVVDRDDHFFVQRHPRGLAKLTPAFGEDGIVTAGNASGIVDGAACVVLASARRGRSATGSQPVAEIVGWHVVGVEPVGDGHRSRARHSRAARKDQASRSTTSTCSRSTRRSPAQYLAVEKDLGPRSRARQRERRRHRARPSARRDRYAAACSRCASSSRRRKKTYGIASACIGGGQGIAILIEALRWRDVRVQQRKDRHGNHRNHSRRRGRAGSDRRSAARASARRAKSTASSSTPSRIPSAPITT